MAMRNQVSISISESENEALELVKQKGIKIIDVFRRGLEAYVKDISAMHSEEKKVDG